ncbi:MAG: hypothetical protein RIF34_05750 [Candidatus Kapaibacterium sp.]
MMRIKVKLHEYTLNNRNKLKIAKKISIGDRQILLLNLKEPPPLEGCKNILSVDLDCNILWVADLPTEVYDSYYDIWLENGIIFGRSSNSIISEIEPSTGVLQKKYMVK